MRRDSPPELHTPNSHSRVQESVEPDSLCQNAGMPELEAVYSHLWAAHTDEFSQLDRSLRPRSWTFLFDVAGESGLGPTSVVADVGCGRGNHCVEIVKRFD